MLNPPIISIVGQWQHTCLGNQMNWIQIQMRIVINIITSWTYGEGKNRKETGISEKPNKFSKDMRSPLTRNSERGGLWSDSPSHWREAKRRRGERKIKMLLHLDSRFCTNLTLKLLLKIHNRFLLYYSMYVIHNKETKVIILTQRIWSWIWMLDIICIQLDLVII